MTQQEELDKCSSALTKVFIENVAQKQILKALSLDTPDMIWAKDIEGKYIFANKAICDGLLMCEVGEAVGLTDAELAANAKKKYGEHNHTFGEVCGDSDQQVLFDRGTDTFLENGKIRGVEKIVKVIKSPMYDVYGKLIGTVGTGRDVTELYSELTTIAETTTCNDTRGRIHKILSRDFYENKDK